MATGQAKEHTLNQLLTQKDHELTSLNTKYEQTKEESLKKNGEVLKLESSISSLKAELEVLHNQEQILKDDNAK